MPIFIICVTIQKVITALRNDNETLACEMERLRSDEEVFIRRENELSDLIKERDVIIDDLKSQVLIAHQETDQQLKEMVRLSMLTCIHNGVVVLVNLPV